MFAVACAGLFPLLHMGRPWFFYWLYAVSRTRWASGRSCAARWSGTSSRCRTYFTVSLLFWYVGLIPDLATLRDRADEPAGRIVYGILAMGWRGSARHWHRYETAYLLLAGLATPLVRLGAHGRQLRLRRGHRARLAFDDLSALLRRRRHLLRLRDGADAGHPVR